MMNIKKNTKVGPSIEILDIRLLTVTRKGRDSRGDSRGLSF